jgi:hypothetical protein
MTEFYQLRVQQMRADAQDGLQKAKLMIARADYAGGGRARDRQQPGSSPPTRSTGRA